MHTFLVYQTATCVFRMDLKINILSNSNRHQQPLILTLGGLVAVNGEVFGLTIAHHFEGLRKGLAYFSLVFNAGIALSSKVSCLPAQRLPLANHRGKWGDF